MSINYSLHQKDTLFEKDFSAIKPPLDLAVKQLLRWSDYAYRQLVPLRQLLEFDECNTPLGANDYQTLVNKIELNQSEISFIKALRQFRHYHTLRLLIRELAHFTTTKDTLTDWSNCADVLIMHALKYSRMQCINLYGVPKDHEGCEQQLHVIAMGKLGGRELNISSDIDLIFTFDKPGVTDGNSSISNQAFFTKMIQHFIQLVQQQTPDGFVFRVDLRLRPNGESGPLVSPLLAMETYYQEQGRDWERYAMVKARVIGEQRTTWFKRVITPFVYRRYVDFSVIESLRSMKSMIEQEVQLKRLSNDIKRGRGGIREIEFILQSVQLIRGGRHPQLRHQNALMALNAIEREELLSDTIELRKAYLFLRKIENMLQIQHDRQTHCLPSDELSCEGLACIMEFSCWNDLKQQFNQYRALIERTFYNVLGKTDVYEDEKRVLLSQLNSVWQGHVEKTMAINLLETLGYNNPKRCFQMLEDFHHGPRCRRLTQAARIRLDRCMILLLNKLRCVPKTDEVLLQFIRLLENTVARSAYLALLTENPMVIEELIQWFSQSTFITSLFVHQPFLLEVLIDQDHHWAPLSRDQLARQLQLRLSHCNEAEVPEDVLRQFKLCCWLLAARAELYQQCEAVRISKFLSDVAEIIIIQVIEHAYKQLSERYPDIMSIKSRFAVIAYGKLGAREMNYDSDLDLVFLHHVERTGEHLVTRLTQNILHQLTTRLQSGVLYPVDTRLRPSGKAGLLVSTIGAFITYQKKDAWTWEHQALLRGRILYGSQEIMQLFVSLKQDVLFMPRDKQDLAKKVQSMRMKIRKHANNKTIKYCSGGLMDLEFLTQYLVLANPALCFINCTNTLLQLGHLWSLGVLNKEQYKRLRRAYHYYHQAMHQDALHAHYVVDCHSQQRNVLAVCQQIYREILDR